REHDAEDSGRESPRANASPVEDRRPQNGGREEDRREDGRESPVVADPSKEQIRLEPVVAPPDPFGVGAATPEARRVVELEEPPAPDGRQGHEQAAEQVRGGIEAATESRAERADEQNVPGPHDRREPSRHGRLAREEQPLGGTDDAEPGPAVSAHAQSRGAAALNASTRDRS